MFLDFLAMKLRSVGPEDAARQASTFLSRPRGATGPLVAAVANSLVLASRGEAPTALLQLAEALGVAAPLAGLAERAGVRGARAPPQPPAAGSPAGPSAAAAAGAAAPQAAAEADPERDRAWVELLSLAGECAAQGRCTAAEASAAPLPCPPPSRCSRLVPCVHSARLTCAALSPPLCCPPQVSALLLLRLKEVPPLGTLSAMKLPPVPMPQALMLLVRIKGSGAARRHLCLRPACYTARDVTSLLPALPPAAASQRDRPGREFSRAGPAVAAAFRPLPLRLAVDVSEAVLAAVPDAVPVALEAARKARGAGAMAASSSAAWAAPLVVGALCAAWPPPPAGHWLEAADLCGDNATARIELLVRVLPRGTLFAAACVLSCVCVC